MSEQNRHSIIGQMTNSCTLFNYLWIKCKLAYTAEFFQLFNFKMKIFQILGHLQYISDQEFEKFSF